MKKKTLKLRLLLRRKQRIRKKISGTTERPRLSVFRSARHIYAQVIDDVKQHTLVAVSSFGKGAASASSHEASEKASDTKSLARRSRANVANCKTLGQKLAAACLAKDVKTVVFDRNGCNYHGRLQALAEGVREGGVKF